MPETLATFLGEVRCERSAPARALILSGMTAESRGEATSLILSGLARPEGPDRLEGLDRLEDAVVEHGGGQQYGIRCVTGEWLVEATAVHLHREIAAAFYRAIPPRPAPWRKRLFWRAVLALAANRPGLAALRMLRRKV
jgi:hypothetical protein